MYTHKLRVPRAATCFESEKKLQLRVEWVVRGEKRETRTIWVLETKQNINRNKYFLAFSSSREWEKKRKKSFLWSFNKRRRTERIQEESKFSFGMSTRRRRRRSRLWSAFWCHESCDPRSVNDDLIWAQTLSNPMDSLAFFFFFFIHRRKRDSRVLHQPATVNFFRLKLISLFADQTRNWEIFLLMQHVFAKCSNSSRAAREKQVAVDVLVESGQQHKTRDEFNVAGMHLSAVNALDGNLSRWLSLSLALASTNFRPETLSFFFALVKIARRKIHHHEGEKVFHLFSTLSPSRNHFFNSQFGFIWFLINIFPFSLNSTSRTWNYSSARRKTFMAYGAENLFFSLFFHDNFSSARWKTIFIKLSWINVREALLWLFFHYFQLPAAQQ